MHKLRHIDQILIMNLRIVELIFEGTPLLDRQSVRLATEFVSHPEGRKRGKGQERSKIDNNA